MNNKRKRLAEAPRVYPRELAISSCQSESGENVYRRVEKRVAKELANMIILHKYPLSIANHVGFQNFSRSINPRFKMVSRKQVRDEILEAFEDESTMKFSVMKHNEGKIAVSLDLWTTQDGKRRFVAATVHFIDDCWTPKSFLIEFQKLPFGYTEKEHMEAYLQCLYDYELDHKLSTLTFDDSFDNKFLKETYSTRLDSENLILGGKFLRMRCFTVTLKALVGVALETLGDLTMKIGGIFVYWTASPKRQTEFLDVASKLGVHDSKSLVSFSETQWDSIYLLLERALLFRDVFKHEKFRDSRKICIPSEEDWNLTKEICKILKLFYETAMFFNSKKHHTANEYFCKVCDIKLALPKWVTSDIEAVKSMALKMIEMFDEYWNDANTLLAITASLDPSYKMYIVEYYFTKIYKDRARGEIARVRKVFSELFQEYHTRARLEHEKQDPMSDFDVFVTEHKNKENVTTELDYYLDEDVLPRKRNFYVPVPQWWRKNSVKYPTLEMIARDLLAIPVSKVASDAVFCTVGNVLQQNFNKLSPKTIEAILCKRDWLSTTFPGASGIEDDEDSDYDKEGGDEGTD